MGPTTPRCHCQYDRLTITGLNKLEGFKLSKMHLEDGPNGANLKGNVFIPNPSVMTITMVCLLIFFFSTNNHIENTNQQ